MNCRKIKGKIVMHCVRCLVTFQVDIVFVPATKDYDTFILIVQNHRCKPI